MRTPWTEVLVALGIANPIAAQIAPVSLAPVMEIGCLDCAGPEAFGSITALSLGSGRLAVADRDEPHVRIFRFDGHAVTVWGPEGDGPGELRAPLEISVAGDSTAVLDLRRLRLALFLDDGEAHEGVRLDGFPLAAAFGPGSSRVYAVLTEYGAATARVVEWRPGGRGRVVVDRIPGIDLGPGPPPVLSLASAPDGGFVIGEGHERYRLLFFGADGHLRREVERAVARAPKSEDEIEEERATRRGTPGGRRSPPTQDERQAMPRAGAQIDPLRVHFRGRGLRFDERGRLWVRTERGSGSTVFDLFDPGGEYLGETTLPGRIDAFALGDEHLAVEVLGDLDVPSVQLWRVTSPEATLPEWPRRR